MDDWQVEYKRLPNTFGYITIAAYHAKASDNPFVKNTGRSNPHLNALKGVSRLTVRRASPHRQATWAPYAALWPIVPAGEFHEAKPSRLDLIGNWFARWAPPQEYALSGGYGKRFAELDGGSLRACCCQPPITCQLNDC